MTDITHGPCLKVLVAYYSHTGNTRAAAQELREKTCGVLFGVETCGPCRKRAVEEEARRGAESDRLPPLKYPVPSMAAYDVILVGGPVQRGTLPAPLMAFLREADFAGRRVAPFCLHADGAGSYFAEFARRAGNAGVLEGLELPLGRRCGCPERSRAFDGWLDRLGIGRACAPGFPAGGLSGVRYF